MVQLITSIKSARDITAAEIARMYDVFRSNYEATSFADFQSDLAEKNFVILLSTEYQLIVGFTTLAWYARSHPETGEPLHIIYSGDTIIEPAYWGTQALPAAWCRLAGRLKAEHPNERLFWFLIVKGHRTYRYLPLFTHVYYPSVRADPTSTSDLKVISDALAHKKFGSLYNSDTGVVHFPTSRGHLSGELVLTKSHLLQKPEVAYFCAKNPGFIHGDELVCLTELSTSNMKSVALRAFKEGMTEYDGHRQYTRDLEPAAQSFGIC